MTVIMAAISLILVIIAVVHMVWAFGKWWPAGNERDLARMVVGSRGIERMPSSSACAAVAITVSAAAIWPWLELGAISSFGLFALALVFATRGLATYTPLAKKFGPEEPFATYDRRYYAPLCLIIGAGFVLVLMERMI